MANIPTRGGARKGAGRPSIDPEGNPVQVAIRIPQAVLDAIDAEAKAQDVTRNEVARGILWRWAKRNGG